MNRMFQKIENEIQICCQSFSEINDKRKNILLAYAEYLQQKIDKKLPIQLVYVCTHNSRRSHFGQIAALLAAHYFDIKRVSTFSGGTEETEFNSNAINALKLLGFEIYSNEETKNPIYKVFFSDNFFTTCFSKMYTHQANPSNQFAAIMMCSDAEQNCPFISGAEYRVATTYEDPKKSDGTTLQNETYKNSFIQILTETLFVFSQLKNN
jgi:arsenate reductase